MENGDLDDDDREDGLMRCHICGALTDDPGHVFECEDPNAAARVPADGAGPQEK